MLLQKSKIVQNNKKNAIDWKKKSGQKTCDSF